MNCKLNTLTSYIDQISTTPDTPLLFSLDGVEIGNGYHVTEIKLANVTSVDCGKGNDNWQEVIVQLLDGAAPTPAMTCAKFQKIMNKAQISLQAPKNAQLFFEFSPDNGPLHRLQIKAITNQTDSILVELGGSKAECKPFSRALNNTAASYKANKQAAQSSCCSKSSSPTQRTCC